MVLIPTTKPSPGQDCRWCCDSPPFKKTSKRSWSLSRRCKIQRDCKAVLSAAPVWLDYNGFREKPPWFSSVEIRNKAPDPAHQISCITYSCWCFTEEVTISIHCGEKSPANQFVSRLNANIQLLEASEWAGCWSGFPPDEMNYWKHMKSSDFTRRSRPTKTLPLYLEGANEQEEGVAFHLAWILLITLSGHLSSSQRF